MKKFFPVYLIVYVLTVIVIAGVFLFNTHSGVITAQESTTVTTEMVVSTTNSITIKDNEFVPEKELVEEVGTLKSQQRLETSSDLENPLNIARGAVANIANWEELIRAFDDINVTTINVIADFAAPDIITVTGVTTAGAANISGNFTFVLLNRKLISRKVVVEGNGHLIDFGGASFGFTADTVNEASPWDVTFKDLTTYHGGYYGFFTMRNIGGANELNSKVTYHNIKDTGNQLIHSEYGKIYISGSSSNIQAATYTTKFRTDWKINATNQTNMFISELTVLDNSSYNVSTLDAGNIELGYNAPGNLTLGKNATMTLRANGTSKNGFEAYGINLLIWKGDVVLGEGAQLTMFPQANASAISLVNAGANIRIGKGARIAIVSTGHTSSTNSNNSNIVYMGDGSSMIVDEEGVLAVNARSMGASDSNIVHVNGDANFIVKKKGTFSVMSDSTSQKQSLLYFGSNGSKFQFADAQRVDLIRTSSMIGTGTNNGLINIAGTGGILDVDIQKVSIWNRDNLSAIPTTSWTPMYGMSLRYAGVTPEVVTVNSLTAANETAFRNGFTTKNTQRVLFEYIPDVEVSINSISTDLVSSNSSTTVSGVATPNSYVRIQDITVNNSVSAAIRPSENKITSPVTTIEAPFEYQSNFTVKADDSGNYSYTVPTGRNFAAGSKIQVYAFLNGKIAIAEQVVVDATPPTGDPREYHAGIGEVVPNPKWFVQNAKDTNPVTQNFTYAYSAENSVTDIQAMLSKVGEHKVKVDLLDNDKNKTTITSKLIVHEIGTGITAENIEIGKDIVASLTDKELRDYILKISKASGGKYVDGVYTDLTDKLSVSNLGGLTSTSIESFYTITLTIPKAASGLANDLTKKISLTVLEAESLLSINFVNEANQLLPGYTGYILGLVGDTIDLTEIMDLPVFLGRLEKAGYEIVGRPANEKAILLTQAEQSVEYKVRGLISLSSVPNTLTFGSLAYDATKKRVDNPIVDKKLVVTDTRADASNGFVMTATLSKPMMNKDGKELANVLRYVYEGKELILGSNAQNVYVNNEGITGDYKVSDTWGNTQGTDGVKLEIGSSDIVYTGDYSGVITWKLMAGQP